MKITPKSQMPEYMAALSKMSRMLRSGRSLSGHERNCVYLNTGGLRFANVSEVSGLALEDDCRTICAVDWDHDGDLDLWLGNRTAPRLRLMRNESGATHGGSSGGSYLSLMLQGRTCNRNAIGARVYVQVRQEDDRQLMRTMRAGNSFLSQSSQWLFFGVGQVKRIAKVAVHWPDGTRDEWSDIPAGQHYKLIQGQLPSPWARPPSAMALKSSPPAVAKPDSFVRVIMADRMPMIHIALKKHDGQTTIIGGLGSDRPVLINLWASWCAPCLGELKEMVSYQHSIDSTGLRIIAASVDGLDANYDTTAADAKKIIRDIGFPFESGMLDKNTVERIAFFQNQQFVRDVALTMPTSFLLDRDGRLAAIYRGPVQIAQLLSDVQKLDTLGKYSTPLAGRWHHPPGRMDISETILMLEKYGLLGDAVAMFQDYARLTIARTGSPPKSKTYGQVLNNIGMIMQDAGRVDQAEQYMRQAITILNKDVQPLANLAKLLLKAGRQADAMPIFQRLAQLQPKQAQWQYALATILDTIGQHDKALGYHHEAVRLNPNVEVYQYRLGYALGQRGQIVKAVKHLEKAAALNPESMHAIYGLAWLIATRQSPEIPAPGRAVQLAQELVKRTNSQQVEPMDLLAIAYARIGQFDKSIETATKALELDRFANRQEMTQMISKRIKLFRANKPYLE